MSSRSIEFTGPVECRRETCGPLGLTLSGRTVDRPGELAHLSLVCSPPPDLPPTLTDPRVEPLEGSRYRISSREREWVVAAISMHLHREVAAAFDNAVPQRPAPWTKRLFWWGVLTLAGSPLGRKMLRAR